MPDGSVSRRPIKYNRDDDPSAGFHHMHRLDLLMCLYKRVFEFAPETGAACPIRVHMGKRLKHVAADRCDRCLPVSRTAALPKETY